MHISIIRLLGRIKGKRFTLGLGDSQAISLSCNTGFQKETFSVSMYRVCFVSAEVLLCDVLFCEIGYCCVV